MSTWPLAQGINLGTYYGTKHAADSYGQITLLPHTTNNVYSAYVEVIAETEWDASALLIQFRERVGMNVTGHASLALGAAGSEVEFIRIPLLSFTNLNNVMYEPYTIPLFIPKGTRISIRTRCSWREQEDWTNVHMIPIPVTPYTAPGFSGVEILNLSGTVPNVNTAYAAGVSTSSPFSAAPNDGGNIFQFSPAIASHWRAFSLAFGNSGSASGDQRMFLWRLRSGAGDGVSVFGPLGSFSGLTAPLHVKMFGPYPCDLPAATRVLLELYNGINTSSGSNIWPVLYGWS